MDLASKAVFGIDGVKLALEKEAKNLAELAEKIGSLNLSVHGATQKGVLTELEDLKCAMSMCHTMITYYQQVLEDLYKDYNCDTGMTWRVSAEDTEVIDFKDLTLKEMKKGLKVV